MTAPKGVRVTVERYERGVAFILKSDIGYWYASLEVIHRAGVPALKPGESVTGRMVFVPEKPAKGKAKR